jgi:protein gp37
MADTTIEWAEKVWNPLRGCTRVSEGCRNCYAERRAAVRLSGPGQPYHGLARMTPSGPRWTGQIQLLPEKLTEPLHWRTPRRIFVNSMSDLFHEAVPASFIREVFAVMGQASWHVFQVLTKRGHRLAELAPDLPWPPNVWQGVSIEDVTVLDRVADLQTVPARVRWLSVEPLLGPIPALPLDGIHWVVCGGESGPGYRAVDPHWVRSIRDQCRAAGVPFFFKQWGGPTPKSGDRLLDGLVWDQYPEAPPAG